MNSDVCVYKNQDCLFNVFFLILSLFDLSIFFIVEHFTYYHSLCLIIFIFIYLRRHGVMESIRWSGFECCYFLTVTVEFSEIQFLHLQEYLPNSCYCVDERISRLQRCSINQEVSYQSQVQESILQFVFDGNSKNI